MSNERGLNPPDPELNAIEAALGALTPLRSRLNRDRVMFLAGQAARPKSSGRQFWVAIAASLGLIASLEGVLLAYRPGPKIIERIVVVHETAPIEPTPPRSTVDPVPDPSTVVQVRADPSLGRLARERLAGQVLRYGLDGLPAAPTSRWADPEATPSPSRQWLNDQLRKTLDYGDPS